jgi:hypothetical protein
MHCPTLKHVMLLSLFLVIVACPVVGRADCYYGTSPNLPPLDGQYVSPDAWHALFAMGIILTDVVHKGFTDSYPPPPPGMSAVHTFGSLVEGQMSMDGGANFAPFWTTGPTTVRIASDHDSGNTRYFDTEMLGMDLSGGSLPMGVIIRESPMLASTGETDITDMGNGTYHIESFFDVFTELSLDGGNSWFPDLNGSAHMVLHIPEPSSLTVLLGFGVVGLIARARRGRK